MGLEDIKKELQNLDIDLTKIESICNFIQINGTNDEIITKLKELNINNETFINGIEELKYVIHNLKYMKLDNKNYEIESVGNLNKVPLPNTIISKEYEF